MPVRAPGRRAALVAALVAAFLVGHLSGRLEPGEARAQPQPTRAAAAEARADREDTCRRLDIFAQVLHYAQTAYVDPVPPEQLVHGAIQGMLDTLDPHTLFMPPDVYREMKIDTTGEFQGIGLVIEQDEASGEHVVVAPIAGSPAARAGARTGDVLEQIDETPAAGLTLAEITRLMRGPVGSSLTLILRRPREGGAGRVVIELTRERVQMESVDARLLSPQVGYVRVRAFQDRTASQLRRAIERLESQIRGVLPALVMDLRDNPGGLFDQGVAVADLFLEAGEIVSTRGRNARHEEVSTARAPGTRRDLPVTLLINGGTASAAEIVAGAIQDHGRGLLVGERSFGKGSVQHIIDLADGSGLKLTVAHYYTPRHRNIHRVGIEPDITVPAGRPTPLPPPLASYAERPEGVDIDGRDFQLWAAFHVARSRAAARPPAPAPR